MLANDLGLLAANAIVPDQLPCYVAAVSGLRTRLLEGCAFHQGDGFGVLVTYNAEHPEKAIASARAVPGLATLIVLGPGLPGLATASADSYWFLDLPIREPRGKLSNMLRRASREVEVVTDVWTDAHASLVREFCATRKLDPATEYIFSQLGNYLQKCGQSRLFSARCAAGQLAAFAIGDYTSLATAFYMFAVRKKDAPPGVSDLLLHALIREAEASGHSTVNLGLGINSGIGFFKEKWGAVARLPYLETSIKKRGWLSRLFGRNG